jgi:2-keto-4-pentenoate hydratase/2-oxohepta-3-ene-1,7-dioic acid hydratase in catechol pathway
MSKFARIMLADGEVKWALVGTSNNFMEIEGDRFTRYNITDRSYEAADIKILPPSVPTKIVAVGLNYKDHAEEMKMALPEEPLIFLKSPGCLIGHGDKIILPRQSGMVEFEAELGIIIKNDIFDIDEPEVDDNILGYTCFNDVTARDLQKKDGQWARSKSFNTFGPMGPCVRKNIDPDNQEIRLYLNGELRQTSNTKNLIFSTRKLVSYISGMMTLYRGDVIITGTPGGSGELHKGDIVEVEIGDIGKLTNFVE